MNKLFLFFVILIIIGMNAGATDLPGIPGNCGVGGVICGPAEKCSTGSSDGCCYGQCIPKTCDDLSGETCTSGQLCFGNWYGAGANCCIGECYTPDPETQTCSDLGGNICLPTQTCNGTTEQASDGACCIGNCETPTPPLGKCSDIGGIPLCKLGFRCTGQIYNDGTLKCCLGECEEIPTPFDFYVCSQMLLFKRETGETIDLGVYWETAEKNIQNKCGENYNCLPEYNELICVTDNIFSSNDTNPASNSLHNLLLTAKDFSSTASEPMADPSLSDPLDHAFA